MSNIVTTHIFTKFRLSPTLHRLTYDFTVNVCHLYYPKDACADMQEATGYVETLFPNIVRVFTVSGDVMDTVYTKEDGVWYASENQAA